MHTSLNTLRSIEAGIVLSFRIATQAFRTATLCHAVLTDGNVDTRLGRTARKCLSSSSESSLTVLALESWVYIVGSLHFAFCKLGTVEGLMSRKWYQTRTVCVHHIFSFLAENHRGLSTVKPKLSTSSRVRTWSRVSLSLALNMMLFCVIHG